MVEIAFGRSVSHQWGWYVSITSWKWINANYEWDQFDDDDDDDDE